MYHVNPISSIYSGSLHVSVTVAIKWSFMYMYVEVAQIHTYAKKLTNSEDPTNFYTSLTCTS